MLGLKLKVALVGDLPRLMIEPHNETWLADEENTVGLNRFLGRLSALEDELDTIPLDETSGMAKYTI